MVTRPVFSPMTDRVGVEVTDSAPFVWSPGFAFAQKQKNVAALHEAIRNANAEKHPLEVSSKSSIPLGVNLSAFNLGTWAGGKFYTVESVYQASKVFAGGVGPFPELYGENPAEVRNKIRDIGNVRLIAYKTGEVVWNLNPTRAFYDWVYCRALHKNQVLVANLNEFNCFTDIAFNPVRSLNCQAYAVSLYLSLAANGVLEEALSNRDAFLKYHPDDIVNLESTNSVDDKSRKRKVRKNTNVSQLKLFN